MKKITMTLAATALIFGSMVFSASAQTQAPGAANFHAQLKNATPLKQAACRGWGPYCPPGTVRRCGPFRCWCAVCY
jgi:hypothetical protein